MSTIAWMAVWAYIAGLPSAWSWAMWTLSVTRKHPWRAVGWDAVVLFTSSIVTLTLWSKSGDSAWVLLGWAGGNMTGTYFVVKHN